MSHDEDFVAIVIYGDLFFYFAKHIFNNLRTIINILHTFHGSSVEFSLLFLNHIVDMMNVIRVMGSETGCNFGQEFHLQAFICEYMYQP